MRKPSVSVDELEDVAASPASSVLSAEQAPVPSKPATVSSRSGRGMQWMLCGFLLSVSGLTVVCEILGSNPSEGSGLYCKSHCSIQFQLRAAHPYCSA